MSVFDYLTDYAVCSRIKKLRAILGGENGERFREEALAELYDFSPYDRQEINDIIDRVYRKYLPESEDEW